MKCLFSITFLFAFGVTAEAQWTPLNSGTTSNLSVIKQNQAGSLFVAGAGALSPAAPGVIMKSDNAGATWSDVANNTKGFSDIVFLTANTGLAIPKSRDTIFKTTDGGNTWMKQYSQNCYGQVY